MYKSGMPGKYDGPTRPKRGQNSVGGFEAGQGLPGPILHIHQKVSLHFVVKLTFCDEICVVCCALMLRASTIEKYLNKHSMY